MRISWAFLPNTILLKKKQEVHCCYFDCYVFGTKYFYNIRLFMSVHKQKLCLAQLTFPHLILSLQVLFHSGPQKPCSFWSAARIATSGKVQQKSAIHALPITLHMLRVKCNKSDWLRVRNEFSAHVKKIRPSQRSRLVLIKRNMACGDENGTFPASINFLVHVLCIIT